MRGAPGGRACSVLALSLNLRHALPRSFAGGTFRHRDGGGREGCWASSQRGGQRHSGAVGFLGHSPEDRRGQPGIPAHCLSFTFIEWPTGVGGSSGQPPGASLFGTGIPGHHSSPRGRGDSTACTSGDLPGQHLSARALPAVSCGVRGFGNPKARTPGNLPGQRPPARAVPAGGSGRPPTKTRLWRPRRPRSSSGLVYPRGPRRPLMPVRPGRSLRPWKPCGFEAAEAVEAIGAVGAVLAVGVPLGSSGAVAGSDGLHAAGVEAGRPGGAWGRALAGLGRSTCGAGARVLRPSGRGGRICVLIACGTGVGRRTGLANEQAAPDAGWALLRRQPALSLIAPGYRAAHAGETAWLLGPAAGPGCGRTGGRRFTPRICVGSR